MTSFLRFVMRWQLSVFTTRNGLLGALLLPVTCVLPCGVDWL
jgi:hypothetical protein